jgi:hypothetical protein
MAPARLLDLTRLVSRLGRGPMTGVDRVEFAYLDHLLGLPDPVYGLPYGCAPEDGRDRRKNWQGFLQLQRL